MFYKNRCKGLPCKNIWFHYNSEEIDKSCILYRYNNLIELPPKRSLILYSSTRQTLVNNLQYSSEDLLQQCTSGVRNEIRRAKKDGITCIQYSSKELTKQKNILEEFNIAYINMHRQKNMLDKPIINFLKELNRVNMLQISVSILEKKVVAYHSYIVGDGIARLLHSVSIFRECSTSNVRNSIARANRLLHFEDMLHFKKLGFKTYDWGGYATDPALAKINSFKAGFGGVITPRFYITITPSYTFWLIYKTFQKVKGLWR